MSYVLFGDEDWKDPKSKIELLEKASYLALDQFNDKAFRNKGERFLQELKDLRKRVLSKVIMPASILLLSDSRSLLLST